MNIFKESLIMSIEGAIYYRKAKALKHPDDARNLVCAAALEDAAEVIKDLPDDYCLFNKLESVNQFKCDCWNKRESDFISRWGFFNKASPADDGLSFVAKLAGLADEYLAQCTLDELAEKLYGKFVDYFDECFIEEINCQLWGCFVGKLTDEYMTQLAEEYRDGLAGTLVEAYMDELADGVLDVGLGTESDMDKAVSERMERHADKIRGEWASDFIDKVGDKILNE